MKQSTRVRIIGTSHIAKQSVVQIKNNIQAFKPDVVAVELDAARYQSLNTKKRSLRLRDIREVGIFGFFFALVGSMLQKYLGHRVGVTPGADMKIAVEEGKKAGAHIALIDRDIRVTVYRLSTQVPLSEKLKLAFYLVFGWLLPSERKRMKEFDLRKVPGEAVLMAIISEVQTKFPNLYKVLIKERDAYMARAIKHLSKTLPDAKILVVVGAGHRRGLEGQLQGRVDKGS